MNGRTLEEKVLDSAEHMRILDLCRDYLDGPQASFDMDTVLVETKLELMEASIRWDVLVAMLEEEGYILLAVADKFFSHKVWTKKRADKFARATPTYAMELAGIYTATGRGKKTAGYADATMHGGQLLLYRMQIASNKAGGIEASMRRKIKAASKKIGMNPVVVQQLAQL